MSSQTSRASRNIIAAGFIQAWAFGCIANRPSCSRCLAESKTSAVSASSGSRYLAAFVITAGTPAESASLSMALACSSEAMLPGSLS